VGKAIRACVQINWIAGGAESLKLGLRGSPPFHFSLGQLTAEELLSVESRTAAKAGTPRSGRFHKSENGPTIVRATVHLTHAMSWVSLGGYV
jgi:hypothetical protein